MRKHEYIRQQTKIKMTKMIPMTTPMGIGASLLLFEFVKSSFNSLKMTDALAAVKPCLFTALHVTIPVLFGLNKSVDV